MSFVKEFIENAVPVYPDVPEKDMDKKSLFYYSKAVDEIKDWLKKELMKELADSGYTGVRAKLYLPVSDVEISVKCEITESGPSSERLPEVYRTPIGEIDYAVYHAIVSQEDNPVKRFYEHLSMLVNNLCVLCQRQEESMMREEFLEAEKITDVLGLHRMEMVLYDIAGFLEGRYWMSETDLRAE